MTAKGKLRVLLVDDHDIVRRGLRLLLERELGADVVEAATGEEAVSAVDGETFGLVLLDARLPGRDGVWTLGELRTAHPDVPVLVLSTFADEALVQTFIELGAQGYVLKDATTAQLREAIDTATSGTGLYLHPAVAQRVLAVRRRGRRDADRLSERELMVLGSIARGAKNDEIAAELGVSETTVKSHLSSVFRKLGVANRTQAAAKAIRDGIVATDGQQRVAVVG